MFCRNCGKELLETDNFCANCGEAINENQKNITNFSVEKEEQSAIKEDLPMNWWNFWKFFRFPVGILITVFNFGYATVGLEMNLNNLFLVLIDISFIVFMCITYIYFYGNNKKGYNLITIYLFVDTFFRCFNSAIEMSLEKYELGIFIINLLVLSIIWGIAWIIPNYIYFKKRKDYFNTEYKTIK